MPSNRASVSFGFAGAVGLAEGVPEEAGAGGDVTPVVDDADVPLEAVQETVDARSNPTAVNLVARA